MTLRQVCSITNNQLIINLPAGFSNKKQVLVIVDDSVDVRAEKMKLMIQAQSDELFQADVKEVNDDFGAIDHESL